MREIYYKEGVSKRRSLILFKRVKRLSLHHRFDTPSLQYSTLTLIPWVTPIAATVV